MRVFLLLCIGFLLFTGDLFAQRKMENLGRGVVAIHSATNEVFVSWRLLGTEPQDIGFNLYRSANGGTGVKLNSSVLTAGTNFTDATANFTQSNSYFVKTVLNGVEQVASAAYTLPANTLVQSFFRVPINNTPGYAAKFIWVGDLDGDGEFDFVFDKQPTDASKTILLEAYKRDGTFLWQLDCGPNSVNKNGISPGSSTLDIGHGDNFTVYDINNDGKSEVIVRTANGVKFSNGVTLTDANNSKQFISVLNGTTGVEISRTPYNNPYLGVGPMNGHMGIAYLDGINPSIIWEAKNRNADDSFNEMTTAWSWNGSTLVQTWQFLTGNQNCPAGHQVRVLDVDGDGKDEVTPMGFAIDHDGKKLWSLGEKGYVHGDRFSVGDLDPSRPGLEGYAIQQINPYGMAWVYYDAKTGEFLNGQTRFPATDLGRGMAGDFDPRYKGYELFTFTDAMYNVSGAKSIILSDSYSYPNLRIWWDGDLGSENLDNKKMIKWNYIGNYEDRMYIDGYSTFPNVNIVGPNTPGFYADIIGDWREEVVFEAGDRNSLVVYTTPYTTNTRLYTLPHNPAYRNSMCVKGYYQSNMLDYYLGFDMAQPPVPPIQKANKYWEGTSFLWDNSSINWNTGTSSAVFANGDTVMFDVSGNNTDSIKINTSISPARIWAMNPDKKNYIISGTGKLTGAMDLIKAQFGTFTLCGNHDYTGQTRISEGSFVINGSLDSKVLVQTKGNLGGIGTLKGGITLEKGESNEGGRLSPGNGILANQLGVLTINGNLVVPGNNNFAFDVLPGSTKVNDSLVVKGDLTFGGVNKLMLNFVTPPASGIYTIIKCEGTLTAVASNFKIEGLSGVPKNLIIENNQIKIEVLSIRIPKSTVWKGLVDNVWNYDKANFEANSVTTAFVPGDSLLFDDSGLLKTISLTEIAAVSKITVDALSNYTIGGTGVIAGTGDLIKKNSNTLTIQLTNNTYTGKTIVEGGTLAIATIGSAGKPSSLGSAAALSSNIQLKGVSLVINSNSVTDRGFTLTGNTTLTIPVAGNYAVFGGVIAGTGVLIKDGPGQLAFIGRNTYSGGTILRNSAITLGSNEANESGLGSGPITIENGILTLADARLTAQLNWNVIVPAGKTASITYDGRCAVNGSLSGDGTLSITMPYVRTEFKGNWSAFTGKINSNGDFRIDNNFGYAKAAINLVTGVAYPKTADNTISFGELSGAAATSISGAKWTIGSKNTDALFNGTIAGNSITKVGTGSWTLTAANTYTGGTNINAGKLIVTNTTGSGTGTGAVSVNNSGILTGIGTITGPVTINNGGVLAPGNIYGTLTVNNTITMQAGSKYATDVISSSSLCDKIALGANKISLNGTLEITNTSLTDYEAGNSFKIITGTNITGSFTSISPAVPGEGLIWDTSELNSNGAIKVAVSTSTPEINGSSVTIFPNPVTSVCSIVLPEINPETTIELYSLEGVKLKSIQANDKAIAIDLSNYSSGIYIIKVVGKNVIVSKRITKISG